MPLIISDCLSLQRAGTIISMNSRFEEIETGSTGSSNAPVGADGAGSSASAPPPAQEVVTDAVCVVPEPQGVSVALIAPLSAPLIAPDSIAAHFQRSDAA